MGKAWNLGRPRRSPLGYFEQACRTELRRRYPNTPVTRDALYRACAQRWRNTSAQERALFKHLARRWRAALKARPPRDPMAPKRPLTAFFIFSSEQRPQVRARSPGLNYAMTAKQLGEDWAALSPEQRRPFEARAAALRESYRAALAVYQTQVAARGEAAPQLGTATIKVEEEWGEEYTKEHQLKEEGPEAPLLEGHGSEAVPKEEGPSWEAMAKEEGPSWGNVPKEEGQEGPSWATMAQAGYEAGPSWGTVAKEEVPKEDGPSWEAVPKEEGPSWGAVPKEEGPSWGAVPKEEGSNWEAMAKEEGQEGPNWETMAQAGDEEGSSWESMPKEEGPSRETGPKEEGQEEPTWEIMPKAGGEEGSNWESMPKEEVPSWETVPKEKEPSWETMAKAGGEERSSRGSKAEGIKGSSWGTVPKAQSNLESMPKAVCEEGPSWETMPKAEDEEVPCRETMPMAKNEEEPHWEVVGKVEGEGPGWGTVPIKEARGIERYMLLQYQFLESPLEKLKDEQREEKAEDLGPKLWVRSGGQLTRKKFG